MKPSERIYELWGEERSKQIKLNKQLSSAVDCKLKPLTQTKEELNAWVNAIIVYLDEQFEDSDYEI